jgi:2-amino-4-hydroxy-6-hydroxymethyldihydropteridine diphosphokinase
MMSKPQLAYLNLGSNIQPEIYLVKAVDLLHEYGGVLKVSNAWESKSVGAEGPNYLNACVLFKTALIQLDLKENVIRPIETRLGRRRSENKFTPRTIDIDIILYDNELYNHKSWKYAFVIVPLAEIYPEYRNPVKNENIVVTAMRLQSKVWMESRPEVLSRFSGIDFKGQN